MRFSEVPRYQFRLFIKLISLQLIIVLTFLSHNGPRSDVTMETLINHTARGKAERSPGLASQGAWLMNSLLPLT